MNRKLKKIKTAFLVAALLAVSSVALIFLPIIGHFFLEARYIPSLSMAPTLPLGSRIICEKISFFLHEPLRRGSIVLVHPPEIELPATVSSPAYAIGDATGLPFLPQTPVFIKRIIALPGDRVMIRSGIGGFINDKLVDESEYIKSPPNYNLSVLSDIKGTSASGIILHPYPNNNQAIIVPAGTVFVLGDNRYQSDDSHVFGFLKQDRIFANVWLMWSPECRFMDNPPAALSQI